MQKVKVVFVPLDERPCNLLFPQQLADMTDLNVVVPDKSILGRKKQPADTEAIAQWLIQEAKDAQYLIVSIDLLVYGGIVPSRLHALSDEECVQRISVLERVKKINPDIKIHAFNLIMRVPNNNKEEEEPVYYKYHGKQIWRYSWLTDKSQRSSLDAEEANELNQLKNLIPVEVLDDFIGRRTVNSTVNRYVVELTKMGLIDNLVIPLDDNSEYGFSPSEQRKLLLQVEQSRLMDKVLIYPGADEIGCTMLTRIFCEIKQYVPEIYVRYSSTLGPMIKPKYEDRTLNESIKSHLTAAGAVMADNSAETDYILMVNAPATSQLNVAEQIPFAERHSSYFSEIHYREFVEVMRNYLDKGKHIALGDVATCNGSDRVLMELLHSYSLLDRLTAYAGWNTSGNTLGTVISHFVIMSYYLSKQGATELTEPMMKASRTFYYCRLVEDFGFQSVVRQDMINEDLPRYDASYYVIGHCLQEMHLILKERMDRFVDEYLGDIREGNITLNNVQLPWVRMFEIGFDLTIDS